MGHQHTLFAGSEAQADDSYEFVLEIHEVTIGIDADRIER